MNPTAPSSPWEGSAAALKLMSGISGSVAAPMSSLSGTLASVADRAADLGVGATALKVMSAGLALPADFGAVRNAWRDPPVGKSRLATTFAASSSLLQDLSALTGAAALAAVPLPPVQIALAATAATLAFAGGVAAIAASVQKMGDGTAGAASSTGAPSIGASSTSAARDGGDGARTAPRRGAATGRAAPNSIRGLQQTVEDLIVALRQGRRNIEHLAVQELRPARARLDATLQGSSTPIHRQTSAALDGTGTALQRTAQSLEGAEIALQKYRASL